MKFPFLSRLFPTRASPKNSFWSSSYSFFFGTSSSGKTVDELYVPLDLKEHHIKKILDRIAATPGAVAILIDPMLATAGSAVAAVSMLKKRGFETIVFVCIVSCPEGVARLEQAHPDVAIYTASIDDGLNASKYILPGLGDAGDRLFGTK